LIAAIGPEPAFRRLDQHEMRKTDLIKLNKVLE
jgi:hypothetical protein